MRVNCTISFKFTTPKTLNKTLFTCKPSLGDNFAVFEDDRFVACYARKKVQSNLDAGYWVVYEITEL